MSHGSPSLFGVMTAGSCWVCGKDSVPEGLPGSFRPGVPKDPVWHSEPDGISQQPAKPQSSCSATLGLWAGISQWPGTLAPAESHHWCLERPGLEHASEFQISAICILQTFAAKMLPHHESYLLSFLFKKFWLIHFDLRNSSNRQLPFLLWISFHRLRFLWVPVPSFPLLSLGSITDCEQENESLSIMFKLYVDKGNY